MYKRGLLSLHPPLFKQEVEVLGLNLGYSLTLSLSDSLIEDSFLGFLRIQEMNYNNSLKSKRVKLKATIPQYN
jgi:hypothetical protein